ncbi:hypothetical protein ACFTWH_27140 [Streptomyces sp. NPDC057011]|uniref:hypothetical protein n=1 Tax=unclassified Streptomyces TaxID=2593676 RepID=UPI0036414256
MSAEDEPDEPLEPAWMLVANVVEWRRCGEGGQGQRPGTKTFKGGAKVYVHDVVDGDYCMVVGRPRNARRHVSAYVHARHLHTFRTKFVRSPAVLRAAEWSRFCGESAEADAAQSALFMERHARDLRSARWLDWHHPEPCLCHECLNPDR